MIKMLNASFPRLLMIVLLIFFAQRVNAYSITQSFEVVSVGNTEIEIYLDPFDANLGTLVDVFIDVSAHSVISSDKFDCTAGTPYCFVKGFASLTLGVDGLSSRNYTSDSFNSWLAGDSMNFKVSMMPYWDYWSGHDFSGFIQAPPLLRAYDLWRCEQGCSDSEVRDGTQTLRGSLTYVYVPVPATIALLAIGLFVLAVRRPKSALSADL